MAVLFALAVGAVTLRVARDLDPDGRPREGAWALVDFRDAVYYPSLSFLQGGNPYDAPEHSRAYPIASVFPLYAPATLVLHLPFALLPRPAAEVAHYLATLALFPLIAWLALRLCRWPASPALVLGIAAAMIVSRPGQSTLFLGQYAALMTAALYGTLLLAPRRPLLGGAVLALTTLKPSFGIPCAALLLGIGMWRTVAAAALIALLANAVPAAILTARAGGVGPFVATLAETHRLFANAGQNHALMSVTRLDAPALVGRLAGWPPDTASDVAVAGVVLGLAILALRRARAAADDPAAGNEPMVRGPLAYSVLCTAVLLTVYHQAYDALLLTLPLVAIAHGALHGRVGAGGWVVGLLLAVPAWNYLGSFSALEALPLAGAMRTLAVSLNATALALALLAAAALLLAARRGRGALRGWRFGAGAAPWRRQESAS
jgi:hypothetical protein